MLSNNQYQTVLRKAELFNYITELITSFSTPEPGENTESTPPTAVHHHGAKSPQTAEDPPSAAGVADRSESPVLPHVFVMDRRVICNGHVLDLAARPRTLLLFRIFCEVPSQTLTRDEVVRRIYGVDPSEGRHSPRYIESHYNNAVKLISRARLEARKAFGCQQRGIRWFVYEPENSLWHLYQLENGYIERHLR